MSLIQQVRDTVHAYEGYAHVWMVSKKTALISHSTVAVLFALMGVYLHARYGCR